MHFLLFSSRIIHFRRIIFMDIMERRNDYCSKKVSEQMYNIRVGMYWQSAKMNSFTGPFPPNVSSLSFIRVSFWFSNQSLVFVYYLAVASFVFDTRTACASAGTDFDWVSDFSYLYHCCNTRWIAHTLSDRFNSLAHYCLHTCNHFVTQSDSEDILAN